MKIKYFLPLLIIGMLLAACAPAQPIEPTPDVNAIRTSAAYTVVAELTLTAVSFTSTPPPPTETPTEELPTETATEAFTTDPTQIALGTPAELCDNFSFNVGTVDVTIPDLTPMTPGQAFVKTWKIKNTGICAWGDGYSLIYSHGEKMSGKPVPIGKVVQTGEEVEVSVNLIAPTKIGEYVSAWTMSNPKGFPFGEAIFVKIVVQ